MNNTAGGRHLIGWAPGPITNDELWMWSGTGLRAGWGRFSGQFMSVPNFYAVKGLEILAELAHAAGRTEDSEKCARESAALRSNIVKHMWDPKAKRFCDGICADPRVGGNHSICKTIFISARL